MSQNALDLGMRESIRNARRSGMTLHAIRSVFIDLGIPLSILQVRRAVEDVPPPPGRTGRRGANPRLKSDVLEAVKGGRSYREAAALTGASQKLVWRVCRHLCLPRGRRPGGVRRTHPAGAPGPEFRE